MGSLKIVSTPIGNRQDISLRALKVLFEVDILLCEDTRKTGQLLSFYQKEDQKKPKLVSFFEGNEEKRINQVIDWLKEGKEMALVSNAGTPLISDPGFKLVRECIRQKIQVSPIPGASALQSLLVVSGMPMDKFMFWGFLPKKQGKKEKLLSNLKMIFKSLPMSAVFYESPFRIIKTLRLLNKLMPKAKVAIGRELTKKYEEVLRGTPKELMEKLGDKKIKGELTVVVRI